MLKTTYVLRQYCRNHTYHIYATFYLFHRSICALSSVNASQEPCKGTAGDVSTLRIVELLGKKVSDRKE